MFFPSLHASLYHLPLNTYPTSSVFTLNSYSNHVLFDALLCQLKYVVSSSISPQHTSCPLHIHHIPFVYTISPSCMSCPLHIHHIPFLYIIFPLFMSCPLHLHHFPFVCVMSPSYASHPFMYVMSPSCLLI